MLKENQVLNENLVLIENDEPITTSKIVADVFGKQHAHVLRDIDNILVKMEGISIFGDTPLFTKVEERNPQNGQYYTTYYINRDGFTLLAMGFTGAKALEWKLKYIDAFNRMEKMLRSGDVLPDKRDSIATLIVKSSRPQIQALKELYPEYFLGSAPSSNLELVVDKNTSYRNWIEDFNITTEWISEFPTLDIYRSYSQYCIENRFIPMGKKVFYKTLEADFNLTRKQLSDGYRYFLTA